MSAREELAAWDLSDAEFDSLTEVVVDAIAWRLLDLTSDLSDRGCSPEALDEAREDARKYLAKHDAEVGERIVSGVRAWCAINEIAAPPLDWEGLGEFLTRATTTTEEGADG